MMPKTQSVIPDLTDAERHLTLLDEESETFTFQTFDDDKARKKSAMEAAAARGEKYRDPLAKVLTGTLAQCGPALIRLNQSGAGVFVTVNQTDGKGRRLENIRRIRALWQEDDGDGKPLPLAPHFEIESSPGKFHRYLLVEGLSSADFRTAEGSLVARFGSDPNAKDPARVLRLAGFFHRKDPTRPHRVRIVAENTGSPYSRLDILRAFPAIPAETSRAVRSAASAHAETADERTVADLRSALRSLRADEYQDWVRVGLALKSLGDVGRGLWLDWSATSPKFDSAGASAKWETFQPSGIGYRAVFESAQQAGWVNPDKRRPGASPTPPMQGLCDGRRAASSGVVDIQAENQSRLEFERRIADTDDFDRLVYVLFQEVEHSGLRVATREYLAKRIAKRAGVSVGALRGSSASGGNPPPRGAENDDAGDWLGELNDRHAVVSLQGAVRVMNIERNLLSPKGRMITFSERASFVTLYENRETRRNGEMVDIATAWLKHPQRRQFRGIAFAPGMDLGADVFNLWEGFGVDGEPKGSCRLFLDFVRDIVCGECEETYAYVWGWMAHLFQRPAELPGTALVLRGLQGTGKNTFAETLGYLVNPAHFVSLTNMDHLTGKFSAHRAGALLLFANEASWGGDRQSEGTLKALVTDTDTLMEEKHRNATKVRNFARLIVATNRDWPVPRDEDDRRFIVLEVSAKRKESGEYFAAIKEELESGGYETLMHQLLTADIEGWHPRQIPARLRERGWDMKIRSGGSVMEWWFECLEDGMVARDQDGYADNRWRTQIPTRDVQDAYGAWCRRRGYAHTANIRDLGSALGRWGVERRRPGAGDSRPWCYLIPELALARHAFAAAVTMPVDYWESDG